MALPNSIETERGLYLQKILVGASAEMLIDWPMPTKDDLALIGSLIVLYSHIDFPRQHARQPRAHARRVVSRSQM